MTEVEIPKDGYRKLEPRMRNPAQVMPEIVKPIQDIYAEAFKGGVSPRIIALVHLRASQINGCSFCATSGARDLLARGEPADRINSVAVWRDAPFFTDAERAALALTECVTRLSDRADPVPDEVWKEATRHYDEKGMSALLVAIAVTNVFNRLNVPTKTLAGEKQSWEA